MQWIAGGVVVLAALAGIGIWYFFKDDAPAAVDLDAADCGARRGHVVE